MTTNKQSTRLFVISDLHLGGQEPAMMSKPGILADFIDWLPSQRENNKPLELVIAGDFIDFLAIPECKAWTQDSAEAVNKLSDTMRGSFKPVFDALGRHLNNHHRLTVLVGNHDIEMTYPAVQDAFIHVLRTTPQQARFIDDGSAYRVGDVLIEHGNRYDAANFNDWDRLRQTRSAYSRNEQAPQSVRVSAGSVIVEKLVNEIKREYPFIDLFQPQDKMLAYLLLALEPTLIRRYWRKLGALFQGGWNQFIDQHNGRQPGRTYAIGATASLSQTIDNNALEAVFGEAAVKALENPEGRIGVSDWLPMLKLLPKDGLAELIRQDKEIPLHRLKQLRETLQNWRDATVLDWLADTGPYGAAAERMVKAGAAELVIMGHTHLARQKIESGKTRYINTGTWADIITLPTQALEQNDEALEHLAIFLKRLCDKQNSENKIRKHYPTYADVSLDLEGHIKKAELKAFKP